MAIWVEEATDNIIAAAKEEFLEYGFMDASLRRIAEKAKTSPRSIYTRFTNKDSLFDFFVKEQAEYFMQGVNEYLTAFSDDSKEEQITNRKDKGSMLSESFVDYIYDNFDAFYLIICRSKGTKYEEFIENIAMLETKYTRKYMDEIKDQIKHLPNISDEFIHMTSRAFFDGFFEMVRHRLNKEDAKEHIRKLILFYNGGWEKFII